jgi:hypothetical protein
MAGSNHLLSELRRQLERLDEAGFAALASAGLLRRARKDLESQAPELQAGDDDVRVKLSGHKVIFDSRGPAHARCTCSSKTVCQHALAACLFIKSLPQDEAEDDGAGASVIANTESSLQAELLLITLPALTRYAGKPAVREALEAVETEEAAQISLDKALVIRLVRPGVEFRYVGGGPESLITEFRGRSVKKLAAQAILAFQRAHGVLHAPPAEVQKKEADVPASDMQELRLTLLAKVERLLRESIDVGLAHLSDTLIERLQALATVAEGAKLHRLSLALSRLSSQVDLILEQHARANSAALFAELATTYALTNALRDQRSWDRVELVGEARSSYEDVAALDLYCAGAYPWQTPSGYWGLTVLFWFPAQARWLTYSDSRPVGTLGFSPTDAYRTAGPWRGSPGPEAIMGRRLTLTGASVNRFGRLSGGRATTASADRTRSQVPDFAGCAFRKWSDLRTYVLANPDGLGLTERNPHADYVVLQPHRFLARGFDGTTQTLLWPIEDEEGEQLQLRLEYSTISAAAVERLDSLQPPSGIGILAQLSWSSGTVAARPLTLLRNGERVVDNLFLDQSPAISPTQALLGKLRAKLSALPSARESEPALQPIHATECMLNRLNDLLLNAAERGAAARDTYWADLASALHRLNDSGLALFDAGSETAMNAGALLRARYLSQVAHACLSREG